MPFARALGDRRTDRASAEGRSRRSVGRRVSTRGGAPESPPSGSVSVGRARVGASAARGVGTRSQATTPDNGQRPTTTHHHGWQPLVNTLGQQHQSQPLVTTAAPHDQFHTLVIAISTAHHHWLPQLPTTIGQQHWSPPTATTTGIRHWSPPLNTPVVTTTGVHYGPPPLPTTDYH